MMRNVDLSEISDGALYNRDSMVKISCNDCKGCSECCHDMGESIILDPYDVYMICRELGTSFEKLLVDKLELNVVDGLILPNIKMQEKSLQCGFLSDEGRCTIHQSRPGFCRLFPLGRVYEGDSFMYFNQVHECRYPNKAKVKVKKWLGIAQISEYENFVIKWHSLTKKLKEEIEEGASDERVKQINMLLLDTFFTHTYDLEAPFFPQFYELLNKAYPFI